MGTGLGVFTMWHKRKYIYIVLDLFAAITPHLLSTYCHVYVIDRFSMYSKVRHTGISEDMLLPSRYRLSSSCRLLDGK